jgi:hypothetical protein
MLFLVKYHHAYITSPNAVPITRQIQWLKELTSDIVSKDTGMLTLSDLSASRDLIYAWSHLQNDNTNYYNKNKNGPFCAMLAVEQLLKRVVDERVNGNVNAELNIDDYNCVLEGWARSNMGEASAQRCEQILETMQRQGPTPNLASFKAVLMAWRNSNVPYAAVRAQRILEWMIRLFGTNQNRKALPDADCFDIVLQLWSRSGDSHAPQKTEQLLVVMEKLHRITGLEKIKPRKTSYNAVLAAWSKSSHPTAPDRAHAILSFMETLSMHDQSVAPDSASYNTVMNSYARSSDPAIAATKANAFLQHVLNMYQQQSSSQSDSEFTSRIHNDISSSPSLPVKTKIQPDTILFNTVMGLWAKAGTPGAYRKAKSILDQQMTLYQTTHDVALKPDVFGLTSVLSSCAAEPIERQHAFRVAMAVYKQYFSTLKIAPNHVSYGTMMKVGKKLLSPGKHDRNRFLRQIFADAVQAGCVGDMVVSKLREAASPDVYRELLQGHSRKQLPHEWTRNVQEQNEYRTRNHNTLHSNKKKRKRAEV